VPFTHEGREIQNIAIKHSALMPVEGLEIIRSQDSKKLFLLGHTHKDHQPTQFLLQTSEDP
jgi:hypothetical protein